MTDHIQIWNWEKAPQEFKNLSCNGGDEDWVAFVPAEYRQESLIWMEEGTAFGCCSVHVIEVEGGEIHIGCHA